MLYGLSYLEICSYRSRSGVILFDRLYAQNKYAFSNINQDTML